MSETSDETDFVSRPGTRLTLLAKARQHDQDAWNRLVLLYSPLVRYWCRAAGIRPDATDDVVQEVFIAASGGLQSFRRDRPGDTFRGWLRGITRNVLLASFRRHGRQTAGQGGTEALQMLNRVPDPEFDLACDDPPEQTQGIYQRALDLVRSEFEERTWQMFWLTAVDGLPAAEVALQFGVTSAAVRKARSRVLHRLKQEVGDIVDSPNPGQAE